MPCGHGRTSRNTGKLVDKGGCSLSKRLLCQEIYKPFSKEHQGPTSVLRNSEQRCIILTFVTLDAWKFLAPFSLLVQGSDLRNYLDSEARVNGDGLESLSPPLAIVFQVDLPKEQKINSSEHPGSANSHSSSGANVLGQSRDRGKQTKSLKNSSSTSLPSSIVSNNLSVSDCDGSNVVSSDVLVNKVSKVDKPVKRVSRKKGKKKGKQYKKSMHKKASCGLENQSEESISEASISGTSISSDTASASELNSQNNMSEKVTSHSLSVQGIIMEQDESDVNNNDHINSLATPLRCTPFGNEIDEYEPIASFSQRSAAEEVSCNQLGMDEGSNHLAIKSCSTQSPEIIRSTSDENIAIAHPIQNGMHCDISCSISFDKDNAPMVDSFIDNWKVDASENCSNDVETWCSLKDNEGLNPSKGGIVLDARINDTLFHSITEDSCDKNSEMSTNSYSSNHYWSKDAVDTDNATERAQCSSQASSSNDFQPVINRRRGRLAKKLPQSLNGIHRFGTANMHDRIGKDSNHSLWQRVQKNGTEECICEPKEINLVSPHVEISPKGSEVKERFDTFVGLNQNGSVNICAHTYSKLVPQSAQVKASSNDVDSSEPLAKATDGRYNVPEKLKRKPSSSSKQGNHYPLKVCHTDKTNLDRPSKIHGQQKGLEISPEVTHQQCISVGLRSRRNDFQTVVVMPGPHHKTQINVEEDTPSRNIHSMVCNMPSHAAENPISPSVLSSNSLDQTQIEVHSDSGKDMDEDISSLTGSEDCRYMKSESESSHADHNKENNAPIPVVQKWLPVGRKDSTIFNTSQTVNLTASVVNESVPNRSNSNNEVVELLGSNSHLSLQMNGGLPYLNPCFEDKVCPSPEADELTIYHPRANGKYGGVLALSNHCLTHEVEDHCLSGFETDLDKIVQAVNDSYKLQTVSEGVHQVTGSPVAEFERFLHSASPVLDQIYYARSCKTCCPDQLVGDSLCRHQFPNIPLRCLWQWYEKPGSYGMEVKVEDYYNLKRSCNGRFEFRAYFVPYLSAIQLFGWSTSSVCANNGCPSEEAIEACEVGEVCNQSVRSTHLGNGELLFEYFESDQPQQRRPLFEKIMELVRGDTSANSKIFGDPLKLECLNLDDLHPASWYSVAWYPIYRIPDGNFRAAFLTYHSIGHFVRTTSYTPGGFANIVSPVVGLQSYNAKGECWFQPRGLKPKVAQIGAALSSDPSEILKERLRTLEQTASVMARASVRKANLRSVNRQPDYEFFVSRRW